MGLRALWLIALLARTFHARFSARKGRGNDRAFMIIIYPCESDAPMFQSVFDGRLFRLELNNPARAPLPQLPPTMHKRTPHGTYRPAYPCLFLPPFL